MKEERTGEQQNQQSGLIACQRCRLRKIRCDRRLPKCTSCERARCACLTTDPTSGKTMPRSYIVHLENRVRELEKELSSMKGMTTLQSYEQAGPFWGGTSGLTFWHTLSSSMRSRLERDGRAAPSFSSRGSGPLTVPVTKDIQASTPTFVLPPKDRVEALLKRYFEVSNAQIPILHRENFITTNYEPLYGPLSPNINLASDFTELNLSERCIGEPPPGTFYSKHKGEDINQSSLPDPQIRRALYFTLQVLAIATTSDINHPEVSSEFHQQAMRYYTDAITTRDRCIALRAVVLLGMYSLARPAFPGVWHVSGMAMRLCIELGLHNEESVLWTSASPIMKDKARRLFWSTYILDRQVSMFLGRPTALPEIYINVEEFLLADDSLLHQGTDFAQLRPWPSYKNVSHHLIKLMRLQHVIKHHFYDRVDTRNVPREELLKLSGGLAAELEEWYQNIPRDPRILNFDFKSYYFEVTYHVTRLLLIRGSTLSEEPAEEQLGSLLETGMSVMYGYGTLWEKEMINFSWAAVNNMFIAATASLYAMWRLFAVGKLRSEKVEEIEQCTNNCMKILQILKKICNVATYSYDSLEAMKKVVFSLIRATDTQTSSALQMQFVEWPFGERTSGQRPGFTVLAEADDVSKVDVSRVEDDITPESNPYISEETGLAQDPILPKFVPNQHTSMAEYMSVLPQQFSQWESFISQPDLFFDIYDN